MARLVLGPVLRHVDETSATVWVETDRRCTVQVLGTRASTFCVEGHHYALVVVEDLAPSSRHEYRVELDGETVWPETGSAFPPPVIRTRGRPSARILFGSCRTAAPHEPPYSLEHDLDDRARGVDSLRAHGLRMMAQPEDEWPDLLLLLGDQVYADDPSPHVAEMITHRAGRDPALPAGVIADFEEYSWLYKESWTPDVERWVLSVVPTGMIFDDHDMIDDWNISRAWVADIRAKSWWQEHIVGGLMSYLVYQHLGNLSPAQLRREGLLERLEKEDDGSPFLRSWAFGSEQFTPLPGGYRFSYALAVGPARVVVLDTRNGRVLDPGDRRILDDEEWAWFVEQAMTPCRHLVIGCSLPVLVPGGLHGFQQWNEALCEGARRARTARWSERLRRALDLEDWAAFHRSFTDFCHLLRRVSSPRTNPDPPASITILSGDIHFSYVAHARFPEAEPGESRVAQVVSSPIRNALATRERWVIRVALSRGGRRLGQWLGRRVDRGIAPLSWELDRGPIFANNMGLIEFDAETAHLVMERAHPDDEGRPVLEVVFDREL